MATVWNQKFEYDISTFNDCESKPSFNLNKSVVEKSIYTSIFSNWRFRFYIFIEISFTITCQENVKKFILPVEMHFE